MTKEEISFLKSIRKMPKLDDLGMSVKRQKMLNDFEKNGWVKRSTSVGGIDAYRITKGGEEALSKNEMGEAEMKLANKILNTINPTLKEEFSTRRKGYYVLESPVIVWIRVGSKSTNSYYGSSQLFAPETKKITAYEGDQIQVLPGGIFLIQEENPDKGYFVWPEQPEFSAFERNKKQEDYDWRKVGGKLVELDADQVFDGWKPVRD